MELIELLKNAVPLPVVEGDQEALKNHWILLSTNYLDLQELHKKLKENKVKRRNFRKSDFNKVAHNESKLTIERIDKIFANYNTSKSLYVGNNMHYSLIHLLLSFPEGSFQMPKIERII